MSPLPVPSAIYPSYWGETLPVREGTWVTDIGGYRNPDSPLAESYLWRVEADPAGAGYVLRARETGRALPLTAGLARQVGATVFTPSERLRIEDYPEHRRRFRQHNVEVYFREGNLHAEVCLEHTWATRVFPEPLTAAQVAAVQQEPALLGPWLDQVLWALLHQRKAEALRWSETYDGEAFGVWPQLRTPKELDKLGSTALREYREHLAWRKKHPLTPRQWAAWSAAHEQITGHMIERLDREQDTGQPDIHMRAEIRQMYRDIDLSES